MPRELDPPNIEQNFILEALLQELRVDGRKFDQFRPIDIAFGEQYGSVSVTLGKTRVFVQVSAEVTKPLEERRFDGIFTITTELSPIASPAFEVGRQTDREILLSRTLERAIRRSNAVDTESLCIISGSKCWSVRADVHVIDADGGLVDASCIAIVAALRHFRRPDVAVHGEEVTIFNLEERVPVPLSIMHYPSCMTFSFFHDGEVNLLDATLQEEQVRHGEMVVAVNQYGEVCSISKEGGIVVDALTLLSCINIASLKAKEMADIISMKLKADESRRDVGGFIAELRAENER